MNAFPSWNRVCHGFMFSIATCFLLNVCTIFIFAVFVVPLLLLFFFRVQFSCFVVIFLFFFCCIRLPDSCDFIPIFHFEANCFDFFDRKQNNEIDLLDHRIYWSSKFNCLMEFIVLFFFCSCKQRPFSFFGSHSTTELIELRINFIWLIIFFYCCFKFQMLLFSLNISGFGDDFSLKCALYQNQYFITLLLYSLLHFILFYFSNRTLWVFR